MTAMFAQKLILTISLASVAGAGFANTGAETQPSTKPAKKTVAALPLRSAKQQFFLENYPAAAAEVNRVLSQKLNNRLSRSGRFSTLDREYLVNIMGEQDLIKSTDTSPAEQQKLGKRLGADYIIVGSIEDFSAGSTTKTVELTGHKNTYREANIAIDYRVLSVETSRIEASSSIRIKLDNAQFTKLAERFPGTRLDEAFCELAAEQMAAGIVDAVFPVRIVKITENEVYLNEGDARIEVNDTFTVMTQGEALVDPESGQKLGNVEKAAAVIRVTRVEAKFAVAQIIEGTAAGLTPGALCRKK